MHANDDVEASLSQQAGQRLTPWSGERTAGIKVGEEPARWPHRLVESAIGLTCQVAEFSHSRITEETIGDIHLIKSVKRSILHF